ncbi:MULTISPECIES: inositol monophosphatase family protein [unclassified Paenibacillus]|uniref:inositol monophosphatase family protein n=1 Tax=unclassified Paenibacillus TaxID=185978 RepID=UPI001AE691E6|nr:MULTISPECIES: inositol monophosphatase family protein [unclassified Paenibacillus]MBP1157519.1 myo-inositol-1(or 4)-monophosphatase [Paenibacillus sp. PvP091]MBP1171744.1 myo-inositol-1(or 4)-monophosphatase [Paenibacillus sp. PvR098]MBP2438125.1 myo-inositol-1(or 4)-monophosphatase [Paenibacillus sp. PvP052]
MSNQNPISSVVGSKSFTAVAINTASKAGEWIVSKIGDFNNLQVKSSVHDLVTEVDKGAEKMIRNLIQTHFPHHAILGEEGVEPGPAASQKALEQVSDAEYLWIVDPLDGTTNFVHGFPFFSVSIALAHKGEVIVGVVYNPVHNELFVAEKGKGSYLKGKRIQVSSEQTLNQSLVATGLSADRLGAMPANLNGIQAIGPKVRNIRVAGSAALHMAYVAAGRLSGFWEIGLNSWDMAAGAILISESGGKVTDTLGNPYNLNVRHVLASNGHIHDEMVRELDSAKATGF